MPHDPGRARRGAVGGGVVMLRQQDVLLASGDMVQLVQYESGRVGWRFLHGPGYLYRILMTRDDLQRLMEAARQILGDATP